MEKEYQPPKVVKKIWMHGGGSVGGPTSTYISVNCENGEEFWFDVTECVKNGGFLIPVDDPHGIINPNQD